MTSTANAHPTPPSRRSPILWVGLVFALGLIVAVLVGAFTRSKAVYTEQIHRDFAVLEDALERYRADGNTLPEEADLGELLVPKYLPSLPMDPWGRPYRYTSNGERYFLATFGKSDDRGGNGEEQDHTNTDGHPKPPVK
ncbi:general secretion pathway protein GspG [Pyxidicoccus fallax]|uniref:General secretion pathway protein GspG n=1 Tax=Pyxidicoccus fallax TaxID=394095 RepID=A0A848LEU3_9BACT|nr:type II secretion system protein GspG [Pyxidicoccus fallax]NMO14018.1 general secretion pathway protein GspG [Pyxidicoccus fallax]NPC76650.1 general secretion pathway protein GspG [Pyxidicoccus fallax]